MISSDFLATSGRTEPHSGIDIRCTTGAGYIHGEPIRNASEGTVEFVGETRSAGFHVIVTSTSVAINTPERNNLTLRYLHMDSWGDYPLVRQNQIITAGAIIGHVGRTGQVNSRGHLHFDVNTGGHHTSQGIDRSYFLNPRMFFPNVTFTN